MNMTLAATAEPKQREIQPGDIIRYRGVRYDAERGTVYKIDGPMVLMTVDRPKVQPTMIWRPLCDCERIKD